MIKMILVFVLLWLLFFFGIDLFRKLTKKKKWSVLKLATYSVIIAFVVVVFLTSIVILF
jgi:NhaP-type Na+/H+ or K+/H+ antiporter